MQSIFFIQLAFIKHPLYENTLILNLSFKKLMLWVTDQNFSGGAELGSQDWTPLHEGTEW